MVGVFVHWAYAPHTVDGVVGKDNPLLLASNFSGTWPGLVALLNTAASLESVGREASRAWTDAEDWTADATFMARLDEWCATGRINYPTDELHDPAPVGGAAKAIANAVTADIRRQRILALMLGDTSMGMINGYFGPRLRAAGGLQDRGPLERRHHRGAEDLRPDLCRLPARLVRPQPAEAGGLPAGLRRDPGVARHLPARAGPPGRRP